MTHIRKTLAIALVIGACNPQTVQNGQKEEPPLLSLGGKADFPGHLVTKGTIAFATPVSDTLAVGDGHGYTFQGQQGGHVTITMTAAHPQCAASTATSTDTFLYLFGPADANGNRGTELTRNDDDSTLGTCQSAIRNFALPTTGEYLIVASTWLQRSGGGYTLTSTCASGGTTCTPPPPQEPMTFARSRIAQSDIDAGHFTADQLFEIGDFLFEHNYTVDEGWGNALTSAPGGHRPRPNLRRIHNGAFGGPDGNNCMGCHNVGRVGDKLFGRDGGGEFANNIFQAGDGETLSSAVERNPPAILGSGYLQQLGIEMTQELQKQLNDAKTASAGDHTARTVQLTSKGVSFGSLVVQADGTTVDFTGVQGVDNDLVVKPFGWKGRAASLRRFVEGGFQVHFGMATQPLIAKHCATPIPNTVGNGPDCHDPDMDGVVDEITEGQLTAMAVYATLQQVPTRNNPSDPNAFMRAQAGETLFSSTGCAGCHTPAMILSSPVHLEAPDLTGGQPFAMDLTLDGRDPKLPKASNGTVTVPLFSDLKRHDMGASMADVKATFGVAPSVFITRPLWGVAASPPYMHDGRAPTLREAILAHDGEGGQARSNFSSLAADDQAKLIEFLQTLSRDPNHLED